MRIDFHIHVKLSKKTNFEIEHFNSMIHEAQNNGLHAITLTEHFNTHRFEDVYGTLDQLYPCNNHYYDADGFKIFTGMEVDVAEGATFLCPALRTSCWKSAKRLTGIQAPAGLSDWSNCLTYASQEA
ncbi:PHP domain-containing protein [Paenibacillus protaetiae]|uniref:PHP domain-containing protein n=1 Tax=Paenibacillus protaetiae TaxID=2509456 RepID=UPI001FC8ED7A|nr:PHP domain-containing protein [Paenibacillus protaetiae]